MKLMISITITILVLFFAGACTQNSSEIYLKYDTVQSIRERLLMDFGWKFALGHLNDIEKDFNYGWGNPYSNAKTGDMTGPTRFDFDDSSWERVDLPHDWGVGVGFDSNADESHGYKKIGRAYPENSIGWYRKHFEIPENDLGKRLTLEFDGIFRDSEVWFNGHPMGRHQSGYTSFGYDITDYVNYGGENVVAVRVDASWYELWSYEGAGIYRHVWLVKTDPLHVARWGTYVKPDVTKQGETVSAKLTIQTTLSNRYEEDVLCDIQSAVVDAECKIVGFAETTTSINTWNNKEIIQIVSIKEPILWSLESPYLYRLFTVVKRNEEIVDTYETSFGIRTIAFDPDNGFFLNGRHVLLKGVSCHTDHGGVGIALPDRVQEFRIEKLKEMGVNAYRCTVHPVAPEVLDVCDRLGMLVINEVRMTGSTPELLRQMESMLLRDRNHPSVILLCLGNEEHIIQNNETGARIVRSMKRHARRFDPVTPVTMAIHGGEGGPVNVELDVIGCNYERLGNLDELHKKFPDKPIILTESVCAFSTRGIYERDSTGRHSAYDENLSPWGTTAEGHWNFCVDRPWLAGTFLWVGFDHGGEPYEVQWPCVHTQWGILDRCGFLKDVYYYFKSWWSDETVLHFFPHWNWKGKEGQEIRVWSYTNCEEAELIVNGENRGRKKMPRNSHLEWNVPYEPGYIEIRGYNGGKQVSSKRVETTGKSAAILLEPDRKRIYADNRDVSMVTVKVVDDEGRIILDANNMISFSVNGRGKIIGICNGDPACHVLENQTVFPTFNGLAMVFVKAGHETGTITLRAKSPGLETAETIIEAMACSPLPFVP